ncbi:MAG: hypothetical protein HKN03_03760 [Acidimicrobiales bacterium]|nr:hypothetical protein [Acidimicrobiales bacterium]
MNRLLTAPNSGHLAMAVLAFIARAVLGGIPLVGGLISFVLLLVVLYNLAKVAMNMMRPATT